MSEEMVMLASRVPTDLKGLVDSDPRNNQEVVRAALWREFGGERKAALERRIEEKERRISMIESEKNERQRELDEERQELKSLKAKQEQVKTLQEKQLSEAKEALSRIPNPTGDNPAVKNWADELEMEPDELLNEVNDE